MGYSVENASAKGLPPATCCVGGVSYPIELPVQPGWLPDGTEGLPQPGTWRGRRHQHAAAPGPEGLAMLGKGPEGRPLPPARFQAGQASPAALAAALGKYASCESERLLQEKTSRRAEGYRDRRRVADGLRRWTGRRPSRCGRVRHQGSVQVQRSLEGHVRIVGAETCGSVWACPCCALPIYAERTDEVNKLEARCPGFRGYILTLTVRHDSGIPLARLLDGLVAAWRTFWTDGRAAVDMRRQDLHVRHYVRGCEVTHGEHGWHPHFHVFLVCQRKLRGKLAQNDRGAWRLTGPMRDELAKRWQACVRAELGGRGEPTLEVGLDLRPGRAADYVSKLGLEVANITSKAGKLGNRTPWQIAADAATGDEPSGRLWREYVRGTKGRRQLTWSRGTKLALGLPELTDEQIVKRDLRAPAEYREIHGADWDAIVRAGLLSQLHESASTDLALIPGVIHHAHRILEKHQAAARARIAARRTPPEDPDRDERAAIAAEAHGWLTPDAAELPSAG